MGRERISRNWDTAPLLLPQECIASGNECPSVAAAVESQGGGRRQNPTSSQLTATNYRPGEKRGGGPGRNFTPRPRRANLLLLGVEARGLNDFGRRRGRFLSKQREIDIAAVISNRLGILHDAT